LLHYNASRYKNQSFFPVFFKKVSENTVFFAFSNSCSNKLTLKGNLRPLQLRLHLAGFAAAA
jgi:hypothetical protein